MIPEAMTPEELAGWLSAVFRKVLIGTTSPKIGTAAASIARVLLEVAERTDVEARLTALEEAANIDGRRTA